MAPGEMRVAILGAGVRGLALARHAFRQGARITAIAEPEPARRAACAEAFGLQDGAVFESWQGVCARPELCNAAIVATLDNQHAEPALASLANGWHLLLEKPMADSLEACRAIAQAQREAGVVLSVCHTLRYLEPYQLLRRLTCEGAIGTLVHIEHMEAIGHKRFVHNYVRGRWGKERENTFLLLHKCCHDLDMLSWLTDARCLRASSFGSLDHFRPERAPAGSGSRCTACTVEPGCAHSAVRLYVDCDRNAWPARDVASVHTREAHLEAIQSGPYGVCAWKAGNDVVDHQTVLLMFEGGTTASCTLSGYSATNGRRTRLQGTEGEIWYDEAEGCAVLRRFDGSSDRFGFRPPESYHPEDAAIVADWLRAIARPATFRVAVDAQEALRTHAIVFAAEQARREGHVVDVPQA